MKNLKKSQQNSNIFWPSNIQKLKKSEHEEFVDKLVLASQSLKHRWLDKSSGQRTEICRWLIEGLYQSYFALPRSSLAIPLSKDAYSAGSPYEMPFSYRAVKDIVDASKETDFIEVVFGTYNPNGKGLVTRLRPKGRLLDHFERVGIKWRQMSPPNKLEGIVLSMKKAGKERRLVERDESSEVAKMQDSLLRLNKFLSHQCISLDLPDVAFASGNFEATVNHLSVSTADVSLIEKFLENEIQFNRNFDFQIEFGKMVQVENKFNNYKAFFQKAIVDRSLTKYKKINLRFSHQVVCTK